MKGEERNPFDDIEEDYSGHHIGDATTYQSALIAALDDEIISEDEWAMLNTLRSIIGLQEDQHAMIEESFGDFDSFKDQFVQQSIGVFGSGWCWLVQNDSSLEILGTPNGENPLAHGKHALMGIDVWEHAYYLDYKNVRPDYVKAILNNSINWSFVSDQLK